MNIGDIQLFMIKYIPIFFAGVIGVVVCLYILSMEYNRLRMVRESYDLLLKRYKELSDSEEGTKSPTHVKDVEKALEDTKRLMRHLGLLA